ncbi:uncharacterized protein UV8b_08049 [Ustilaginoidea virens]|uniref:DASH complex subunit DAD1 n=1 Tax=Ustilaginoidea virens TaxID=1159556 RepID=A0A8E5MKL7_USTVR|nr:uncharacterized protein UV8b_08049 [Ustilaginoidea virens]QUC23808.1 hypothetical protein UV8b_08049 [Ustilaginoidea virens]
MAKRQRTRDKTYFEEQRQALILDIATSFEHVLANINKLNRGLEDVIKVGNEFSAVEALWSQFENVMGKDDGDAQTQSSHRRDNDKQDHDQLEAQQ